MKNRYILHEKYPTVLLLVRGDAKLERECADFCPRLLREEAGLTEDRGELYRKNPLYANAVLGIKMHL